MLENKIKYEFNLMQDTTFLENKWRIFQQIDYSFLALCIGIDVQRFHGANKEG